MKIDVPDSPGMKELLDQFGEDAVKLEMSLRKIGESNISSRILAIASELWMAHSKGEAAAIIRDELRRRDLEADHGG